MAITLDQATVFTGAVSNPAPTGATYTFNTTGAVASGAHIILIVERFNSGTPASTLSVTDSLSLTWTEAGTGTTGNVRISIFVASAPSGKASGTSISVTNSAGNTDFTVGAYSLLGVDTSGTLVGSAVTSTGAGPGWAPGNKTGTTAGNALIGGAGGDGTLRTSTPGSTTPTTNERIDFNSSTSGGSITLVDKLGISGGTDTVSGTWSGALTHVAIVHELKAAAGGGTDATVTAVVALALGSAPAPVVSGTGDATVTAAPALAVRAGTPPAVSAGSTVTSAIALALGSAPAVNSSMSAEVVAAVTIATGAAPVPLVQGGGNATVTAAPALSVGALVAPSVQAGSAVTGVPALAVPGATSVAVSVGVTVTSVIALALGSAPRPTISPAPAGATGATAAIAVTFAEDSL